jgi:uncharacterized protein YecE (DUF72 family)
MIFVGTSGWQYRHWRGRFYPRRPAGDELRYYAGRFQTVEVNGTFYRLPEAKTFGDWAARTPEDFVFALKASRFLTHIRRLRAPSEPVRRLMERASKLGAKLGPVLLQLPPDMRCDEARLEGALEAFGERAKIAVEFRHDSWFTDGVRALLRRHDAALCLADRGSRMVTPAWRTAEWGYMRFHEGRGAPPACYGRHALDARAAMLLELFGGGAPVYVYFNNDAWGCAPRDALRFAAALRGRGVAVSRVPAAGDVRVG